MANYVERALKPLADIRCKVAAGKLLEAITEADGVKKAHQAFLQSLDSNEILKASHGLAVQLLNCISAAYYENALLKGEAVIFTRLSRPPAGDYLALGVKPEICGFLGPLVTLLLARQHPDYKSHQAWSTLVEVAELERLQGDQIAWGQLSSYIAGLKRYRPDMTTVHGICLANGYAHLTTLNPGGILWSDRTPWTDLLPWIAHVVEVYNSLGGRDPDMQYCVAQEGFHRWDIRTSGVGLAVTPFHVGPAPGRTTFACFEVGRLPEDGQETDPKNLADLNERFDSGVVEGFWKFSWQWTDSKTTESELLTYLHRNGWVPGLVRHYPETTVRGEDATAIRHPSGEGDGYVKDILHLGSIGQPLSQCETAGDLLDTMYDLIETHAHLCELGVIHRDVSYYNVMCKPQHYILTHPVLKKNCVLERPCIKKIFGDKSGQSCVLLTDLDHATTFSELAKEPIDASNVVGTRMFMSVFLSDPTLERDYEYRRMDFLLNALEGAETKEPDLFRRAFPTGDNDFIAKFRLVVEQLKHKDNKDEFWERDSYTVPLTHHDWWHDAESIYWVFLYAFGRARPLGPPVPEGWALRELCRAMFTTSTSEWAREQWLKPGSQRRLLRETVKHVGTLLDAMATYMAIPWHRYCGEGGIMAGNRDHVHVAFRRLILWFKLEPSYAEDLRVCFDTAAPRATTAFEPLFPLSRTTSDAGTDAVALPVPLESSTLDARFSTAQKRLAEQQAGAILHGLLDAPPLSAGTPTAIDSEAQLSTSPAENCASTGVTQVSVVLKKRKADSSQEESTTTIDGDTRCIKRSKTSHAEPHANNEDAPDARNEQDAPLQPANELDASQKRASAMTGPRGNGEVSVGEPKGKADDKYDASLHLHSRSAKALRLMVLKDRALWFGSGKLK